MSDPTLLTHTTPYGRITLGDLLEEVAFQVGRTNSKFTSEELTQVKSFVNRELNEWRIIVPDSFGYGQMHKDITWVANDNSVELDSDFAELIGVYIKDSDGNISDPLNIVDEADFYNKHITSYSPYSNLTVPVARIWRQSTNRKRVLTLYPKPTSAIDIRVIYRAFAEKLVNNADTIEAPPQMISGIAYGVAERFFLARNELERATAFNAKKQSEVVKLQGPKAQENAHPLRARFFDELAVSGFSGFRQGTPDVNRADRWTRR